MWIIFRERQNLTSVFKLRDMIHLLVMIFSKLSLQYIKTKKKNRIK